MTDPTNNQGSEGTALLIGWGSGSVLCGFQPSFCQARKPVHHVQSELAIVHSRKVHADFVLFFPILQHDARRQHGRLAEDNHATLAGFEGHGLCSALR